MRISFGLCAMVVLALAGCSGGGDSEPATVDAAVDTAAKSAAETKPAAELTVYSARNEQLIEPIFNRYTEETGVKINFLTDKEAALLERLKAEGSRTPADVLITVDAGNLWQAAQDNLLAPIQSQALEANVPSYLRDPQNRWFGLSIRARTIIHSPERAPVAELSTYEDLADPKWKGRLCLRSSKKVYNQSLVATMIATLGNERAEQVIRGWVANLATAPFASDDEVIDAIAAGRCDVGIVNTYYLGRKLQVDAKLPVAVFWPNQGAGARGVHINVSGAGLTAHSKQPQAAQQFIEWLSAGEAQRLFADVNLEYPVNSSIDVNPLIAAWGAFDQDQINVAEAGAGQVEAVQLMDRVGYR